MKGIILILLGMSFMLQGCAALVVGGAGGAAAVAYVKGELETTYGASLDRTYDASLKALKDMQITVLSSKKDATAGTIEATKADGTKVKVSLETAGPGSTLVKIRVGTFGDKDVSMAINSKIGSNLGIK
jgi:hypothetical protein